MKARTFLLVVASLLVPMIGGCAEEQKDAQVLFQEKALGPVQLLFPSQSVAPGEEVEGIIRLTLQPGSHTYWKNPGETGLAPAFDWELPQGIQVKELLWPTPSLFKQADSMVYGYEGTPEWIVRLSFDKDMAPNAYKVGVTAFFLICNSMCTPLTSYSEYTFNVSPSAEKNVAWNVGQSAIANVPIPLSPGKGTLTNNSFTLTLPLHEEQTALANEIIVFSEIPGIFPPDIQPTWKKDKDTLSVAIPLVPEGSEILRDKKEFSGLVQLVFPTSKRTYFINVPVTYSMAPIPTSTPEEAKLWNPKQVTMEKILSTLPSSFNIILIAAFFGGLILNITPCVLPVVGLKMLHLLSLRGRGNVFLHGLFFTLGILVAFWALAGGLYLLEHAGEEIGWGFQLQQPFFVSALILILFIFGLSLFGLFEIGTSLAAWAGTVESGLSKTPSYLVTFISGLFATLIASPCTGPLLGSVLGFAVTFEPKEGFYLFTAIGLGMSFPFLLVTIFPSILRILPRPGPWMIGLKQFFGFLVLATVLWLLWVLNDEVKSLSLLIVFMAFILLGLGGWILGRWGAPVRSLPVRIIGYILALSIMLLGAASFLLSFDSFLVPLVEKYTPKYPMIQWQPYSKHALQMELKKGHVVFVDFSAKWCLTCQANKVVFLSPKVVSAFHKNQIVSLHADWTNGDEKITEMLRALGRNGVPVYAIFKPGEEPLLLPEILTPELLVLVIESTKTEQKPGS